MTASNVSGISIKGISCALPRNKVSLAEYAPHLLDEKQAKRLSRGTGFTALRVSTNDMTTADLVAKASENILADMKREEIGALVFVSQTPDYDIPATSHILQDRLRLASECLCMDINEGCSGYVTGLYVSELLSKQLQKPVLLGCGDTISKLTSPEDRATRCIFGDAGTATLISPDKSNVLGGGTAFSFSSWGKDAKAIMMENSGCRKVMQPKNDGCLYLDGKRIMDFALEEVKEGMENFLEEIGCSKNEVSLFACHQANKRILSYLSEILQVSTEKVPFVSAEIGNESSASIPLVLTQKYGETDLSRVLCAGFGVGLSLGLCLADFSDTKFYGVAEL